MSLRREPLPTLGDLSNAGEAKRKRPHACAFRLALKCYIKQRPASAMIDESMLHICNMAGVFLLAWHFIFFLSWTLATTTATLPQGFMEPLYPERA
jgi:hypothetical protein